MYKLQELMKNRLDLDRVERDNYELMYRQVYDMLNNGVDRNTIKTEVVSNIVTPASNMLLVLNPLLHFVTIDTKEKLNKIIDNKEYILMEVLRNGKERKEQGES